MSSRIIYDSLEDFALRGPLEGSVSPYEIGTNYYELRVVKRSYFDSLGIPNLIEVSICHYDIEAQQQLLDKAKLWLILGLNEDTKQHFPHQFSNPNLIPFAIIPEMYRTVGVGMFLLSAWNDVSIAFAVITGLHPTLTVHGNIPERFAHEISYLFPRFV